MDKVAELLRALYRNLFAESTFYEDQHAPDRHHRVLNTILLLLAFRILADIPVLRDVLHLRAYQSRNDDSAGAIASAGVTTLNVVIPTKAGVHFDLDGRNMDSRLRGNDDWRTFAGVTIGALSRQ